MTTGPRSAFDRRYDRKADEAYFTIDPRPVPALLKHLCPRGVVWECAAGRGDMTRRIEDAGYVVVSTDLVDRGIPGIIGGVNFLDQQIAFGETIVTNPPNNLNYDFVRHGLQIVEAFRGIVAVYQRDEWWCGSTKAAELFDHPAFAMKIVCRFRPRWVEVEAVKKVNPFHRWSWYVWDWHHVGPPVVRFA